VANWEVKSDEEAGIVRWLLRPNWLDAWKLYEVRVGVKERYKGGFIPTPKLSLEFNQISSYLLYINLLSVWKWAN
jgi:hypothetical protein